MTRKAPLNRPVHGERPEAPPAPPKVSKRTLGGDQNAEAPPTPPAKARGNQNRRAASDVLVRQVLELVLLDRTFEAEAALRELNAARRHGLNHRHRQQIERIEQYFQQVSGRPAWPGNFQPGQLIHFRDVLGQLCECVPLAKLLDDLKAEAGGRNSLLYFISTEQGKRASRWEMLALKEKEEQHERDKLKWQAESVAAYERLFGKTGPAEIPSWVVLLEDERRRIEHLMPLTQDRSQRVEMEQRLEFIKKRVQNWEQTQSRPPLPPP